MSYCVKVIEDWPKVYCKSVDGTGWLTARPLIGPLICRVKDAWGVIVGKYDAVWFLSEKVLKEEATRTLESGLNQVKPKIEDAEPEEPLIGMFGTRYLIPRKIENQRRPDKGSFDYHQCWPTLQLFQCPKCKGAVYYYSTTKGYECLRCDWFDKRGE